VACRAIVSAHARTFYMASRLLPAVKRRGAFAIYAMCRTADDLVDNAAVGEERTVRVELDRFRSEVRRALDGRPIGPVLRELAWAVDRFGVPDDAIEELLDGVASDLDPPRIRDWGALESYCEGVAGSVGAMACAVFGVRADAQEGAVLARARQLGVAMQLTNILRDVGEDARRGRCYLPDEELAAFNLDRKMVLDGRLRERWPEWRRLMAFQVGRARELYGQAVEGIAGLEEDSRRCALACAAGYAGILTAIERRDYDTLSGRAAATRLDHLRVAWQSFRLVTPTFGAAVGREVADR
jgi:phytoene synthase